MQTKFSLFNKLGAFLMIFAMFFPMFLLGADTKNKAKSITDDQKILHVLNRLGFGARPGDVEKVKSIGLKKYLEQQLNANSKDSPEVAARLKNFEVLNMETSEIFAKYPNPGALLRQLEGGKRNAADNAANNQANNPPNGDRMTEDERKARQEKLRWYYQEYGLRPANQITQQMQMARIIRATYSENQLEEQMVDFWMNHFNVFAGKAAVRWFIPSYERDVIRKNALGNFKDLVVGTARHPAMLFYLDNFQSVSPDAQNANGNRNNDQRLQRILADNGGQIDERRRERMRARGLTDEQIDKRVARAKNMANNQGKNKRGINENYARELMELHTLGVDGGYTQADIVEVAKAFTGWTIADPRGYRKAAANDIQEKDNKQIERVRKMAGVPDDIDSGEFYFNENWHDKSVKTVLGQKVNEGGMKDGLKVIDILVSQPATAKFIAKKLAVKFVSDNPSQELVDKTAQAFQKSNGDIKTTLRAMFDSPEFYAPENYRAKIKTPFELLVSSLRALDADVEPSPALLGMLNKMGEPLYGYQAPTGYPDTAEDWVNTGALLERMNFAVALASNRIPQTKVNLAKFEGNSQQAILDKTIGEVLHNEISANTKTTLLKQIELPLPEVKAAKPTDETDSTMMMRNGGGQGGRGRIGQARLSEPSGDPRVFKVVGLLLGSPEFQRQ